MTNAIEQGHGEFCGRAPRAPVCLMASIEVEGIETQVKLRNISTGGALVEGQKLPGEGHRVVFRRSGTETPGIIAWSDGRFAGIRFNGEIVPENVMRKIRRPVQPPVSSDGYRRPGFRTRPLTQSDIEWARRWAVAPAIDYFGD